MDKKVTISRKRNKRPTSPKKNKRQPSPNLKTPFIPGNQFWLLRSKHGRDKLFASAELLWIAACEYFQWCQDNPLYETRAFAYQGTITTTTLPKMRAMTMAALCLYLNCNEDYFRQFKNNLKEEDSDFSWVISQIEAVVYSQKFEGAAADLLNANIIARELGLSDKSDVNIKTPTITGINYIIPDDPNRKANI